MVETYKRRPNFLLLLCIALIIAAAGYIAWKPSVERTGPTADDAPVAENVETIGGTIVYVEGGVEYRRPGITWTRADAGVHLEQGYEVETFLAGRAIIRLDDGSVLRLDGGSIVTLTSLDPDHIVVTNGGGMLYSRVAKLDRTFQVATGGIIYESLGTAYATIHTQTEIGVEVYESKVKVKDIDEKELAIVDEGKRFYVASENEAGIVGKVTVIPKEKIEKDPFIVWNATEDDKEDANALAEADAVATVGADEEDEGSSTATEDEGSIMLRSDGGGKVSWSSDVELAQGFKVAWSKSPGPAFPPRHTDANAYVDGATAHTANVHAFNGDGTYYVRVCAYSGDGCTRYSNEITVSLE